MISAGAAIRMLLGVLFVWTCDPSAAAELKYSGAKSGERTETVVSADLAGQVNPQGLMFIVDAYRRWVLAQDGELGVPSSYLQAGCSAATTPSYGRLSVHGEWLPVVFAMLRLQYDVYRYYGMFNALLSFPSGDAPFGQDALDARTGTEETGWGSRTLVRPTLMAKAGPIIITNRTDLAYFRFDGKGPYFLEWTYETLLKDSDWVFENRTNVLLETWKGAGSETLLVGPYYEITKAASAGLVRTRAGMMVYWVPRKSDTAGSQPRYFAQAGWYLRDPNRSTGELTAAAAMGLVINW